MTYLQSLVPSTQVDPVEEYARALKGLTEDLLVYIDVPEPNCRCHISPPCSDCMEYGAVRETIQHLKDLLVKGVPTT